MNPKQYNIKNVQSSNKNISEEYQEKNYLKIYIILVQSEKKLKVIERITIIDRFTLS